MKLKSRGLSWQWVEDCLHVHGIGVTPDPTLCLGNCFTSQINPWGSRCFFPLNCRRPHLLNQPCQVCSTFSTPSTHSLIPLKKNTSSSFTIKCFSEAYIHSLLLSVSGECVPTLFQSGFLHQSFCSWNRWDLVAPFVAGRIMPSE